MLTLKGTSIYLRALEPEDLDFLYEIENNEAIWELSNTQAPYSKYILKQYLQNAYQDIYQSKQLRLVISTSEQKIGLIDLFDFDPMHKRAGLGIIINQNENRGKGYGAEALKLLVTYAFECLCLHQVYANINNDNLQSIAVFERANFTLSGIKKEWNYSSGKYKDELLYQLINPTKN